MSEAIERFRVLERQLRTRSIDLGRMLDELRWAIARALKADRATLYLVDHVRHELVSRSVDLPPINHIRLRIGEGLAGRVADEGRPARLLAADARSDAARRMDAKTGYQTRTMIAVPIHDKGRVIGVLQVLNKRHGDFTDDDEHELVALSVVLRDVIASTSLASQLDPGTRQPLAFQFNHILGDAPAMLALYDLITRAADADITVLLSGESGTGKNLVAHALHDNSPRRDGPFVVVDCGALPDTLFENELFGHVAGAYTGADKAADGKVAAADGGTLFLDEVGELSIHGQKKLLRLIQEHSYFPVGGTTLRQADMRIVCATNVDLDAAVAAGTFRRDLLYRLRVVELRLPGLVDRGPADLDRLTDHYLFEHARKHHRPGMRLTREARARMHAYGWPGNVRELRHVLEAAVVLARDEAIGPDDLRLPAATPRASMRAHDADVFVVDAVRPLREVTAAYAAWATARLDDNRSATSRALDISRNTLAAHLDRAPDSPLSGDA
ncbi:MAG: sigma-54-dependent Fis family transcriptional regulator [Alphaproteobacteria bacterium]|nr:sigma-54-dependent Fis family transcriptional regulator [Alphaproteobacteria bacterium]